MTKLLHESERDYLPIPVDVTSRVSACSRRRQGTTALNLGGLHERRSWEKLTCVDASYQAGGSVIPWALILKHAPAMLAAADALLVRARGSAEAKTQGTEARLSSLEQRSSEAAQLLKDMAQQIQAMAVAQEIEVRRARIAVAVAIAAGVLATCACILAFAL